MTLSSWQTLWQIVAAAAAVVGILAGFAAWKTSEMIKAEEAAEVRKQSHQAFVDSIYLRKISAFWVEVEAEVYRLGVILHVLNKDATRARTIDGISFKGHFAVEPGDSSFAVKEASVYAADAESHEHDYFLKPGTETGIPLLLPAEVKMHIIGGVPDCRCEANGFCTWKDRQSPPVPAPRRSTR